MWHILFAGLLVVIQTLALPKHMEPVDARQLKENDYWTNRGQQALEHLLNKRLNHNTAKNVVLFLGDGMSIPTLTAARIYQEQLQGRSGEEGQLYWETFPFSGFVKPWCLDKQVADSACTSTALMTGVKTNYGTLGINGHVIRGDCTTQLNKTNHLSSLLSWAMAHGKSAGIVTTMRVTHASPGGSYAHVADRNWECDTDILKSKQDSKKCLDIALQLITQEPGMNLQVVMGGGRSKLLGREAISEAGIAGERTDGRNLIEEWRKNKAERGLNHFYSWNRTSVRDMIEHPHNYEYVLGLYKSDHMSYNLQQAEDEPTLEEMTEAAVKVLGRNEKGFVLFVEGGNIDMAHHNTWAKLALDETVQLAKAVKKGRELTSIDDTLILVTSDHSHTMSFSGYADRGHPILGTNTKLGLDGLPYMTLSYANGRGYKSTENGVRHDVRKDNIGDIWYRHPATVPLLYESHGGDDVAIFASGPWSHLFTGTIDQTSIPYFITYASCIRENSTCDSDNQQDIFVSLESRWNTAQHL